MHFAFVIAAWAAEPTPPEVATLCVFRERRAGGLAWVVRVDRGNQGKGLIRSGRYRCMDVESGVRVVTITQPGGELRPTGVPDVWAVEDPSTHAEVIELDPRQTLALRCTNRPTKAVTCEMVDDQGLIELLDMFQPEKATKRKR